MRQKFIYFVIFKVGAGGFYLFFQGDLGGGRHLFLPTFKYIGGAGGHGVGGRAWEPNNKFYVALLEYL